MHQKLVSSDVPLQSLVACLQALSVLPTDQSWKVEVSFSICLYKLAFLFPLEGFPELVESRVEEYFWASNSRIGALRQPVLVLYLRKVRALDALNLCAILLNHLY